MKFVHIYICMQCEICNKCLIKFVTTNSRSTHTFIYRDDSVKIHKWQKYSRMSVPQQVCMVQQLIPMNSEWKKALPEG